MLNSIHYNDLSRGSPPKIASQNLTELAGLERFAGRWARLEARIELSAAQPAWPRLELDRGAGFSGLHSLALPECPPGTSRLDYVLRLPRGVLRARLTHGRFLSFHLKRVSGFGAGLRMLGVIAAADGMLAAACNAWRTLGQALRPRRRAAAHYALVERYQDLRVRRGNRYSAWLQAFEPRTAAAARGRIAIAVDASAGLPDAEYVAFVEQGDSLHALALATMEQAIDRHPGAGLLYSDEDRIDDGGRRFAPYFKCAFNYELLLAQDMIGGLAVYRRALMEEIGPVSGAHDRALRAIERLRPEEVVHVPHVLYHRSAEPARADRAAVAAHLERRGVRAAVQAAPGVPGMARVRFALPQPAPVVTVIVATRDRAALLARCLAAVARSTYRERELIIVDNGSRAADALALIDAQARAGARVLREPGPFNFARLNNLAVRAARGEFVCLLNNDVEMLAPGWLEEMVSFALQQGVGAVGARLWYPDGGLQHGGVIPGLAGDHAHRHLPRGEPGYFGRAAVHQSFSALTGACLLVRKSIYEAAGGMDERLAVSYNDIDFCLRVRAGGYRNVWTPYAQGVHAESASRPRRRTAEEELALANEAALFEQRWGAALRDDPASSPNLSLDRPDFSLAWPPRRALA
jgi:O-antigen biosynthesis protein